MKCQSAAYTSGSVASVLCVTACTMKTGIVKQKTGSRQATLHTECADPICKSQLF